MGTTVSTNPITLRGYYRRHGNTELDKKVNKLIEFGHSKVSRVEPTPSYDRIGPPIMAIPTNFGAVYARA